MKRRLWVLGVMLFLCGCGKVEETPQAETEVVSTDVGEVGKDSVFGAVPYFQDDTGKDAQLVDGYLYGYFAGKLCRYDAANNYREEILYDAGAKQPGAFCIQEGVIYFLTEETEVSTLTHENTRLYKMNCDGSELVLLQDKIPDLEDGWYHYAIDIYEDIIYVYDEFRYEEPRCYRLETTDSVVPVPIEESVYGKLPKGFEEGNKRLPALPYMLRNYGFVLLEKTEDNCIYAYDLETETMELLNFGDIQVDTNSFFMTHEAVYYCEKNSYSYATQWYRLSLDNLQKPEKWIMYEAFDYGDWVFWGPDSVYFVEENWEKQIWEIYEADCEAETARRVPIGCKQEDFYETSSVFAGKSSMWYWDGEAFYYSGDGGCCDDGFAGQDCIIKDTLAGNKRVISVYNENPEPAEGMCYYKTEREIYGLEDTDSEYTGNQLKLSCEKAFLRGDSEAVRNINQYIATEYDKLYEKMVHYAQMWEESMQAEDAIEEVIIEEEYVELTGSDLEFGAAVTYADEQYIVFCIMSGGYWSGAAHPNYYYTHYVFDRATGERLAITDIVDKDAEEICDMIAPYIELDYAFDDWTPRECVLEPDRLFLTEKGIGIFFNRYEIDCYAAGEIEFIIPYSVFE